MNDFRVQDFSVMKQKITDLVESMSNISANFSGYDHGELDGYRSFTNHDSHRLVALIQGLHTVSSWPIQDKALKSLYQELKALREIEDGRYGLGAAKLGDDCCACETTLKEQVNSVADDIEKALKASRICLNRVRLGQRASCDLCRK